MTIRLKTLWNRIRHLTGRILLWRAASKAYDRTPEPGSAISRFQEGEQIPLKGFVFVVGRTVGGPMPVLLLTPVEQTGRARKSAAARQMRSEQHASDKRAQDKADMIRAIEQQRRMDRLTGSR
jgi:hypothetical protein